MYAPRAPKKLTKETTGMKKLSATRKYCEQFDKGNPSNKIAYKTLMHRIDSKRKPNAVAGFVTFKE